MLPNPKLLLVFLMSFALFGCACQKVVSNQTPPVEAQAKLPEAGSFQLRLKQLSTDLMESWRD